MKRLMTLALLALSACKPAAQEQANLPAGPPAGPPPIPPYQMRAELPTGNRLAAGRDGEALYSNRCGACHLAGGMATNLLTVQMLAAKRPPTDGLLTNRKDLTPDYVKTVVRAGKNAMPRQTRVDITDAELESVAAYLGKAGQ